MGTKQADGIVGTDIVDKGITGDQVGDETYNPTQTLPSTPPPIGQFVMAKSPAANGTWQMAQITVNPEDSNRPLVGFQDGTQYYFDTVQISAPIAPPQAPVNPTGGTNINLISTVKPIYNEFVNKVAQLNTDCNEMFQMPLHVVIKMAYNLAYRQQQESTGKVDVIGNEALFMPDDPTFRRWMIAYLEEVQRRESDPSAAA